jgi:hypothetical protein
MRTLFTIAIIILTNACGMDEAIQNASVSEETSNEPQEQPEEKVLQCVRSCPAGGDPDVTVIVSTSVEVHVGAGEGETIARGGPLLILDSREMSQYNALESAPEGYRLITRTEALELVESGEIYDYLNPDEFFWTASDGGLAEGYAWLVDATRGDSWSLLKISKFSALYILEGEDR